MPRRLVHVSTGVLSGAVYSVYRSNGVEPLLRICEVFGAAVGGYVGSRLPDILEPAKSWDHRRLAHSGTAGAVCVAGVYHLGKKWEDHCRTAAERLREKRRQKAENSGVTYHLTVLECLLHGIVGFLSGLFIGYLSHLALDAFTPSGIAVLGLG